MHAILCLWVFVFSLSNLLVPPSLQGSFYLIGDSQITQWLFLVYVQIVYFVFLPALVCSSLTKTITFGSLLLVYVVFLPFCYIFNVNSYFIFHLFLSLIGVAETLSWTMKVVHAIECSSHIYHWGSTRMVVSEHN